MHDLVILRSHWYIYILYYIILYYRYIQIHMYVAAFLSKTEKQTAFPIKTVHDTGNNYNLRPPTIKGCKLSRKRWEGNCYRHLYRVLFNGKAGIFSSWNIFFSKSICIFRVYSRNWTYVWFFKKRTKYLRIWAKMYKTWKYF